LEIAFQSLRSETPFLLFPRPLPEEKSILINGLIWMGEPAFMKQQIEEKN
jgi:hypothetical protein